MFTELRGIQFSKTRRKRNAKLCTYTHDFDIPMWAFCKILFCIKENLVHRTSLKTSFITSSEFPSSLNLSWENDKINFNGINKSSFIIKAKLLSIQFRASKSIISPRGAVILLVIFIILFSRVKHLNRYESKMLWWEI